MKKVIILALTLISLGSFGKALPSSEWKELFSLEPLVPSQIAKNTLIYWINGDAERFRPAGIDERDVVRVDVLDADQVRESAKNCDCNIVLVHDQRGSDTWYTNRDAFGAYLEVYSKGEKLSFEKEVYRPGRQYPGRRHRKIKLKSKSVSEINQADPEFLSALLEFAQRVFPETQTHLIYRGHSFAAPYNEETKDFTAAFDYSHKDSAYSMDHFARSFQNLSRDVKLSTVTFAACTMSYLEMLVKLAPYTDFLIASQIPILETGNTGFKLGFDSFVSDEASQEFIASQITKSILGRFEDTPRKEDYIREASIAMMDLRNLEAEELDLYETILTENLGAQYNQGELADFSITVRPSHRYIQESQDRGVSEKTISILKERANMGSVFGSVDLLGVLNMRYENSRDQLYLSAIEALQKRISTYGYSEFTKKTGVNLRIPRD